MKKIFCILFLLIASVVQGQNAGVKKTIETFFEGFQTRDTVIIKSVCGDKMILQSIAEVLKGNKFNLNIVMQGLFQKWMIFCNQ